MKRRSSAKTPRLSDCEEGDFVRFLAGAPRVRYAGLELFAPTDQGRVMFWLRGTAMVRFWWPRSDERRSGVSDPLAVEGDPDVELLGSTWPKEE